MKKTTVRTGSNLNDCVSKLKQCGLKAQIAPSPGQRPGGLKFLSDDEVELAAADFLPVDILLETVSPVNAQETHHRQEDTHAHAGGTLHVEGVEVLNICPGITAFEEGEGMVLDLDIPLSLCRKCFTLVDEEDEVCKNCGSKLR